MKLSNIAIALCLGICLKNANAADPKVFAPKCGIQAKVLVNGGMVSYEASKGSDIKFGSFLVETEKPLRVEIADYNFDGYSDFSVSHIDDGMGTYSIFHIWVYFSGTNSFVPLLPKCGDIFINVVLDKSKRTLTNSYFSDNQMKSCAIKY